MHTFVAWCPDKTAAGTLDLRLSLRPQHLERLKKLRAQGIIKTGGPTYTPETLDSESKHFTGSVVWFEAESLEAARALVEGDLYFINGVWDQEKLVVAPFATPSENPPPAA